MAERREQQMMMTPTKMKLRVRKKESVPKTSQQLVAETSPDSKCPICLDRFNNVASLDRCLHRFCFPCIHEWSKNKAECPLCKLPFTSIFHSVKAENDFKEFVLTPMQNGHAAAAGAPPPPPPPAAQPDAGNPASRTRRPRAPRGAERRNRRQQTLSETLQEMGEAADALHPERGIHHLMLHLTERRISPTEERALRRLRHRDVVTFRRALYRTGVRVRSVRDGGRQRDVSAAHLRRNPACLRRLLPWLQRELTVLYGQHGSLISIVQHIIMSRITRYDMDGADIRDELRPFLLARTDHFLHELVSFARSTLPLEAYDQQAVYESQSTSYREDSRSDSSIIAISEDNDEGDEAEVTEDATQTQVPLIPLPAGAENSPSQSAWDDETPGPSYSTLFPSPSQLQEEGGVEPAGAPAQENEAGGSSGTAAPGEDENEDECMIVGYVKPMAERTPELVQLSSDSSEEEQEAPPTEAKNTEPSSSQICPLTPNSYLRPLSPSSCPCPSVSRSPRMDGESLQGVDVERGERDAEGRSCLKTQHAGQRRFKSRSRSRSSSGSERSARSGSRGGCSGTYSKREDRRESGRRTDKSLRRSPTVSIRSDSSDSSGYNRCRDPLSPDWSCPQRSGHKHKRARYSSSSPAISPPDSVDSDSSCAKGERNKTREGKRKKTDRDRSLSPHSVRPASHSRRRDPHRRPRLPRSSSSSSNDEEEPRAHPPCLEKPAGKRKYKTRHLERAARRRTGTKSRDGKHRRSRSPDRKPRPASRSPSVEIIYESRPALTHRARRRRRARKRRLASSPTVIVLDSDSDRTADYQDRIAEVATHVPERRDPVTELNEVNGNDASPNGVTEPTSGSLNSLLESLGSVTPPEPSLSPSPECTLNLEHCMVDVVDCLALERPQSQ